MCYIVLCPYDLVYTGVGTFWGSGEKESDCWDNRRAPDEEAGLLNFYTIAVRSQNISEVVTVGAILRAEAKFAESSFHDIR
jgi:hypothetical protein